MKTDLLIRVGLVWWDCGWCSDGGFYWSRRGEWLCFGVFVERI
jgi:hypothetical protein